MQTAAIGAEKAVRVARGGRARATANRLGAGASGVGGMSEVADHSAESRMDREVFHLEIRGRKNFVGVTGAGCGCIFDFRKRVAGWPTIHLAR